MRILLTGSSGRIGRAIYNALAVNHSVIGIDRTPFSTTRIVADFADLSLLKQILKGVDAVIHTAGLHAPHVGIVPDVEFERVNVEGTRLLLEAVQEAEVRRLVFTSTTAVFGQTVADGECAWITDETIPRPRSIYHYTKLAAEALLQQSANPNLAIRTIRMARCFPEPADQMAVHRLARGVDLRDVADAHVAALTNDGLTYQCCLVSGATPFHPEDCDQLAVDPARVLQKRVPLLVTEFKKRGWPLPASIDRVYAGTKATTDLGWQPRFGFEEILAQVDRGSLEVLPVRKKC